MNDPAAKPRPSGEPRLSIDLDDIERRLRESLEPVPVPAPAPVSAAPANDPLAELARLVGNTGADPFGKVFAAQPGISAPPAGRMPPPLDPPPFKPAAPAYAQPSYAEPAFSEPSYRGSYRPSEPEPVAPPPAYDFNRYQPQPAYEPAPQAHQHDQSHAQADEPWIAEAQPQHYDDQYADYAEEPVRRPGRAKLLIGAAIVVAAGGIASAFVLRGGGSSGEAPTILANSGPVKVQPAQPAEDPSKPNISVLDRNSAASKDSKVVQSEEQPVDLGAAARSNGPRPQRAGEPGAPVTLAPPPPPPVANSLFAEPKKVKAVAVRPDGTIIDPNAPAAPAAPAPAAAAPVAAPKAAPAAKPADKPTDIAGLVAASSADTPSTKAVVRVPDVKPAAPAPAPVPAPRPAATGAPMNITTAAATPTPAPVATATAAAGTYAVQLVGTTSSDEAKAALERVSAKFRSELGSYRPTIVKAEDNGRAVYRVRVINMSSDDANKLCAKLKASGGTCFVARS